MFAINIDQHVRATPEAVFSLITTARRLPEWCTGVLNPEPDDHYPLAGGRLRFSFRVLGVTLSVTQWSLEVQPPEVFAARAVVVGGVINGRWNLRAEEDGTRVFVSYDYKMTAGRIAEVLTEKVLASSMRANQDRWLQNIEALLVGGSAPVGPPR